MHPLRHAFSGLLAATALAGCSQIALEQLQPGTPLSDVRRQAGAPTEERLLPDGSHAWYYAFGPGGYTTYRIRYGADNRVLDRVQTLTEDRIQALLRTQGITQQSVADALGPPGRVIDYPNTSDRVWTYSYLLGPRHYLLDVHFDLKTGVFRTSASYPSACDDMLLLC